MGPGTKQPPVSPPLRRAVLWSAAFAGAGVLLLGLVLLAGFALVMLLIRLFLGVVGEQVSLRGLYDGGGDTALHGLLGGHLALLLAAAAVSVVVSWLALALLRRWEEVRSWWPSAQGLLAAGTAYGLVAVAACVATVLGRALG